MKKLLFTLVLLTLSPIQAGPHCTARYRKNFKTGVLHNHDDFVVKDCNCACTGPRTEKNICLQCGHYQGPEEIKTRPGSLATDIEEALDEVYNLFPVDLVPTDTRTKKRKP